MLNQFEKRLKHQEPKDMKIEGIINLYIDLIKSKSSNDQIYQINDLIFKHFEHSGLRNIKRKAWKRITGSDHMYQTYRK